MRVACLWFFLIGGTFASTGDPEEVAVAFIEKVRLGTLNLDPGTDTALSPHTSAGKRKEISRRIDRLAADLGKGRLESSDARIEGDLAGVLIRDTGGFDPSRMRVFAVALVKLKNGWSPAPLPASFENTAAGLSIGRRDQITPLENWLLRSQIQELERLRDESQQRMKREISQAVDPQLLRSGEPKQIADGFLDACAKRNLPAVLGFLGGLQQNLPEDWADRLRSADAALHMGRNVGWPWRLVMAPEVVRVPVDDGGEQITPLFSFACLDPAGRGLRPSAPEVEILHLEVNKDDEGLWRIELPPSFFLSPGDVEDEAEDDFDQALLDSFPGGVRKIHPAKPAASMEQASASLGKAFQADSLIPLFSLMDLEGDPGTAGRGCGLAARSWWSLHNPDAPRFAVPLDFHEQGKFGIAAFQFFSPRETNALDIRVFHFEKSNDGWLLIPGMRLTNSPADAQLALRTWADERTRTWKDKWQASMLRDSPVLPKIEDGKAPPADEARELVNRWLAATHASDIHAMLGMVTLSGHPGETSRTLRNMGYEISTANRDGGRAAVIHTAQGKNWTVIGVKSQTGKSATYPFYLALATPAGPRLLIAADLFGDSTSGRDRLNDAVLARLKETASPQAIDELRTLIADFRGTIPK